MSPLALPRSRYHADPTSIRLTGELVRAILEAVEVAAERGDLALLLSEGLDLPVNNGAMFGGYVADYRNHAFVIRRPMGPGAFALVGSAPLCLICWGPLPLSPARRSGRKRHTCSQGCRSALVTINARNL